MLIRNMIECRAAQTMCLGVVQETRRGGPKMTVKVHSAVLCQCTASN